MSPHAGYIEAPSSPAGHGGGPAARLRVGWGYHGTSAAIEYAVLVLEVERIVVCGHGHGGGIRALYEGAPSQAVRLAAWLELGREATTYAAAASCPPR